MFGLGTCLLLCSGMTIAVKGKATKTVKVDCFKGKSINAALNANKNVDELTIEIDGICYENVIVDRDNVTLRGINLYENGEPEDGIEAASMDEGDRIHLSPLRA